MHTAVDSVLQQALPGTLLLPNTNSMQVNASDGNNPVHSGGVCGRVR